MKENNEYSIDINSLGSPNASYDFQIGRPFFDYFENTEVHDADCRIHIEAVRETGAMKLDVRIEGTITVECDRCLEDAVFPVDYEAPLYIRISDAIEKSRLDIEGDEEVWWLTPAETKIDLRQYLYDSILLTLPIQRVHGTDENGVSLCNPEILKMISFEKDEEI